MAFTFPDITGEHVVLAKLSTEHIEGVFQAGHYPEIWPYMFFSISSRADAQKLVNDSVEAMKSQQKHTYVIVEKKTDRVVGCTSLYDFSIRDKHLEIGSTWYTPAVWGTIINTESKYMLLQHCFEELNLERVQIKTDGRNIRSQRAIEKLGATKEGILRRHYILPDGFVRDTVLYSILTDEWPAIKVTLEDKLLNNHC